MAGGFYRYVQVWTFIPSRPAFFNCQQKIPRVTRTDPKIFSCLRVVISQIVKSLITVQRTALKTLNSETVNPNDTFFWDPDLTFYFDPDRNLTDFFIKIHTQEFHQTIFCKECGALSFPADCYCHVHPLTTLHFYSPEACNGGPVQCTVSPLLGFCSICSNSIHVQPLNGHLSRQVLTVAQVAQLQCDHGNCSVSNLFSSKSINYLYFKNISHAFITKQCQHFRKGSSPLPSRLLRRMRSKLVGKDKKWRLSRLRKPVPRVINFPGPELSIFSYSGSYFNSKTWQISLS